MVFVTVQDFHSMCQKHYRSSSSLGSTDSLLKASRTEILTLFMRSTLLALLFLSFTWLSLLKYGTDGTAPSKSLEADHSELLPLLLNDMEKEGLFRLGDKALLLSGGDDGVSYSQTVIETEMLLVSADDEETQSKVATGRRKLLSITDEEAKEKALRKLEDVLLEPPRAASRKSRTYLKRTRYLPDLMGDSLNLESYTRRVFIDVGNGKGSSGTEWFVKNYPTRSLKFEMYKIETVNDEMSLESEQMGMTEWLKENVREEEYVVMKAEAEVVEEMMKSKSIKMVDELFLECKPKGLGSRGRKMGSKSGRAYWECLALYGKLRDEGVAVHQWWG